MNSRSFNKTTRDPDRIDKFLDELKQYWHKYPDLRFWQVVCMLCDYLPNQYQNDPFYCEDNKWLMALEMALYGEEES